MTITNTIYVECSAECTARVDTETESRLRTLVIMIIYLSLS
jgi:uncharacterized protein YlaI